MQQPIGDGRGQHLVACQQVGPVADALFVGDDYGAAAATVGDQAKEQVGLLAIPLPMPPEA